MSAPAPPQDMKDRLKASYDAMAPEYNAWTERHNNFREKYLDELLTRVPKLGAADQTSSVLELGCGSGAVFLNALLRRAPNTRAVANDLSDTQINLAREALSAYGDRVQFEPGDMTKLSFPTGSLTAVVALYSLIHLPQDEQAEMLGNIASWLEPGGVLLATFSEDESTGHVFETWLHEKGWMYWSGLGAEKTTKKLEEGGLKIEKKVLEGDTQEKFLWIIARK